MTKGVRIRPPFIKRKASETSSDKDQGILPLWTHQAGEVFSEYSLPLGKTTWFLLEEMVSP